VTYQLFDNMPSLVTNIEVDFMDAGNLLQYDEPLKGKKKGCILEIVEVQKRVLIRLINDRAKRTRGQRIAISRLDVPKDERFHKRKRGVFDLSFINGSVCAKRETQTNNLPQLSTGSRSVASKFQSKVNEELMQQYQKLTEGAKKTQEDIQERAREELVQKAIWANRAATLTNKRGKTINKKSAKNTRSHVDPVAADDHDTLPPIMQRQAENIARNNKVLAGFGLMQKGPPLDIEESSSSGGDGDGDGDTSGSDGEDMNARLVEQAEEVLEILLRSCRSDWREDLSY
jgi:hypothetical protein